MTLKDWADVAQSIAVAAAGVAAIVSLFMWRIETRRKFEWELARRTLRAVYRMRDAINSFRAGELSARESGNVFAGKLFESHFSKLPALNDLAEEFRDEKQFYVERWTAITQAGADLAAELAEVEAVWGADARAQVAVFESFVDRLYTAVMIRVFSPHSDWSDEQTEQAVEDLISGPLLDKAGKMQPNRFDGELDEAVETAERVLVRKLQL